MSVFATCEQIAFPMAGKSAVFNLCWSFPDGDGIDDLTLGFSAWITGSTSNHVLFATSLKPHNIARERHHTREWLRVLFFHGHRNFLIRVFVQNCQVQLNTPLQIHMIEHKRK
jgi:hypothetical protein